VYIRVKDALCSAPVLLSPNFELPFILQTDASDNGIGGVLSQRDENDEEYRVANFYCQASRDIQQECLAVKLSV